MEINKTYFVTASIYQHEWLLALDNYKNILIESWKYLVAKQKIILNAFVIMPNHIHLILKMNEMNGKETPISSFFKFTAHTLKTSLTQDQPDYLYAFRVDNEDRTYQIWKRKPYPIWVFTQAVFIQKLTYIHYNPLQEHWQLAKYPEDYKYSSASFYKTGIDEFGILTHYKNTFTPYNKRENKI